MTFGPDLLRAHEGWHADGVPNWVRMGDARSVPTDSEWNKLEPDLLGKDVNSPARDL